MKYEIEITCIAIALLECDRAVSSPLLQGKVSKKEYLFLKRSQTMAGGTLSIDIPIAFDALSLKFVSTSSRSQ